MPLLNNIVTNINAQIQAKLSGQEFQVSQYNGITIPITRTSTKDNKTSVFPAIRVPNTKDTKVVILDDKYNIIAYHKLISNTYSIVETEDFGDDYTIIKQVTQMQLVIWAQSSKIGFLSESELEAFVSGAIFGEMKLKPFFSLFVSPTSTNFDKNVIFNQEHKNVDNILQNDHLYFLINYKIESTFDKSCFDICDCTSV